MGNELPEGIALDEATSPGGVLELVAYEESGTVWIGVRPKGSPMNQAIGLHTGSREHYVEATSSLYGTWGVAFGAVSPEIIRVEVRNDHGETFDGRIVPLPSAFGEPFRAAWGVAHSSRNECNLIGYDDKGHPIDGSMIRPRRFDLTADERLELIRAHCDNGLRYLTWALERMPSIPEQAGYVREVENSRRALAHILAYVEGADEERAALSAVDGIVQRYATLMETEVWEPGNCSFCGERPVAAWFEGPDFQTFVRSSDDIQAEEAWLACSTCLALVEAEDRDGLARRGATREGRSWSESGETRAREIQTEVFWSKRDQT